MATIWRFASYILRSKTPMGFFFRRSARAGPFRLNFSKSGIGASLGVKGARFTMTPRGTTYITVGTHGFYYRETLLRGGDNRTRRVGPPPRAVPVAAHTSDAIPTADISDLVDSSTEQLVTRLNERARQGNPAVIFYVFAAALLLWGGFLFNDQEAAKTDMPGGLILAGILLIPIGIWAHRKNIESRLTRLFYELNDTEAESHNLVRQALGHLARSQRIWRIEGIAATSDWKRNAGASSLVRRKVVSIVNQEPPRVKSNVVTLCLNAGNTKFFFMPDVVLVWQNGSFGAIAYRDFAVEYAMTRFIEGDGVPSDATVVDQTWRFVNKNGGPDRRFNNNVQLPVVNYGVLRFSSANGLNIHLNTSNVEVSLAFANCWRELHDRIMGGVGREKSTAESRAGSVIPPTGEQADAFKMLGLNADASPAEISAAYRSLAQMYHPDKVAALAPEFQALAEMRMKEINAAYELLKGRKRSAQTM